MYEKNAFAGGHAHSVEFRRDGKQPCFVDTGFVSNTSDDKGCDLY
jgi:predicted NAD/FAD-binding protein